MLVWQSYEVVPQNNTWKLQSTVLFCVSFSNVYQINHSHVSLNGINGTAIIIEGLSVAGFVPQTYNNSVYTGINKESKLMFIAIGT